MAHQPYPSYRARTKAKAANEGWLTGLFIGGLLAVIAVVGMAALGFVALVLLTQDRVPANVSVDGVEISSTSFEEAMQRIETASQEQTLTLTDVQRQWEVRLSDMGVRIDEAATRDLIEQAREGQNIQPYYTVNLVEAQNMLVQISEQVNIPPAQGEPPRPGRMIEIPSVLDRLRTDATGELADGILELTMIEVESPLAESVSEYTGATTVHVVEKGQELALIARQYGVTTSDIVTLNEITNPDLIFVGQELRIPAAGLYEPSANEAPPAPLTQGKSIVVSVEKQRIYAYEDGKLVYSRLTSTGRAETPTLKGDFNIYVKYEADDMSGPGYFLPQVPYTMYFYKGYGIHGTYWHNSFGRPMSHGCVNLPVEEARWFFEWAEVGTLVRVI
jgi:lipoprotein-anchoring transpeptidase ErfK/SrfK